MGYYKDLSTPWRPIAAYLTHDPGCRCAECCAERRQPEAKPKPRWFKVPVVRDALCARCEAGIYPAGWATYAYGPFVCARCRDGMERQGLTTKDLREEQER